jgi:hypothetical protein
MRFWDSSALVPLVTQQGSSAVAEAWLREDADIAVWTLAAVEISSALRRLARQGLLSDRHVRDAEVLADERIASCTMVVDVEAVKTQARRLLALHPLRAADAMQLAAALEWAQHRPAGRTLCTFDGRLGLAALREGFSVLPPPDAP